MEMERISVERVNHRINYPGERQYPGSLNEVYALRDDMKLLWKKNGGKGDFENSYLADLWNQGVDDPKGAPGLLTSAKWEHVFRYIIDGEMLRKGHIKDIPDIILYSYGTVCSLPHDPIEYPDYKPAFMDNVMGELVRREDLHYSGMDDLSRNFENLYECKKKNKPFINEDIKDAYSKAMTRLVGKHGFSYVEEHPELAFSVVKSLNAKSTGHSFEGFREKLDFSVEKLGNDYADRLWELSDKTKNLKRNFKKNVIHELHSVRKSARLAGHNAVDFVEQKKEKVIKSVSRGIDGIKNGFAYTGMAFSGVACLVQGGAQQYLRNKFNKLVRGMMKNVSFVKSVARDTRDNAKVIGKGTARMQRNLCNKLASNINAIKNEKSYKKTLKKEAKALKEQEKAAKILEKANGKLERISIQKRFEENVVRENGEVGLSKGIADIIRNDVSDIRKNIKFPSKQEVAKANIESFDGSVKNLCNDYQKKEDGKIVLNTPDIVVTDGSKLSAVDRLVLLNDCSTGTKNLISNDGKYYINPVKDEREFASVLQSHKSDCLLSTAENNYFLEKNPGASKVMKTDFHLENPDLSASEFLGLYALCSQSNLNLVVDENVFGKIRETVNAKLDEIAGNPLGIEEFGKDIEGFVSEFKNKDLNSLNKNQSLKHETLSLPSVDYGDNLLAQLGVDNKIQKKEPVKKAVGFEIGGLSF